MERLVDAVAHTFSCLFFNTCVDLAHLFGHLFDRSADIFVFVLGHRETEQLLDAAVVRLPWRTFFLNGGPQGLTVGICKGPERGEPITHSTGTTPNHISESVLKTMSQSTSVTINEN